MRTAGAVSRRLGARRKCMPASAGHPLAAVRHAAGDDVLQSFRPPWATGTWSKVNSLVGTRRRECWHE